MKGTLREGSFTRDPKRYEEDMKQGLEMDVCFHKSPTIGEHGGVLLS
jgi:hypothetical protein